MKLIIENWNKFLSEEEGQFPAPHSPSNSERAIESLKQVQEILLSIENDPSIKNQTSSVFEIAMAFALLSAGHRTGGLGARRPISSFPWFKNLKILIKDRIRRFENGSFGKPNKESQVDFKRTQNKILSSLKSTFEKFFSFTQKLDSLLFKENFQQHSEIALELLLDNIEKPRDLSDELFEKYKQKLKETEDPKTIKMIEYYFVEAAREYESSSITRHFKNYYIALAREYSEKFTGDLQSRLKEILLILRSEEFDGAYVTDLVELVSDLIGETNLNAFDQGF